MEGLAGQMGALLRGEAPAKADMYPGQRDDEPPREDYDDSGDADAPHKPAGEPDDLAGQDEGELTGQDEAEGAGEALATVDDAQKKLGLSKAEFNALQVRIGDQVMTLGELKGKLPDLVKLDADRETLETDRGTWELERVATYRNINAVLDQLPRNALTANLLREIAQQHEADRDRELQNLHFARPRWADAQYATGQREKMTSLAKQYGFARVEIESVLDHRHILMLQDFADLKEKFQSSRDAARKLSEPSQQRKGSQPSVAQRHEPQTSRQAKPTFEDRARRAGSVIFKR
jgi:hypothetical protein